MKSTGEEFQIIKLGLQDELIFQQLTGVFREVFEMSDREQTPVDYLTRLLSDPKFIVFVGLHENKVVGGLTAYELTNYYTQSAEIFIYDIAVMQEWQRKGLGQQLISAIKEYCRGKGINEFFVDAYKEDKNAIDFYHATGGLPEKVIQFSFSIEN